MKKCAHGQTPDTICPGWRGRIEGVGKTLHDYGRYQGGYDEL